MELKDVRYFFRDLKQGIKNLIIWFPVIWKDRWWDHWFFYVLLHKKLSLMEENIRKYGIHVNAEQDADKIKICVNILKRLIDDKYHEIAHSNHKKKWGESKMNFIDTDDPELSELKITYDSVKTDKDKEQQRKDFRRACEKEQELREQDLDMLFTLLRKHIQTWWD